MITKFNQDAAVGILSRRWQESSRTGLSWYHEQHEWLRSLSDNSGIQLEKVTAACAILSINQSWKGNKLLLEKYIANDCHVNGLDLVMEKLSLLDECDLTDNSIEAILRGNKIINFYHNLLRPDSDSHVTIDRHAAKIAGWFGSSPSYPALYIRIAQAYRDVANQAGVLPSELQAALWCDYVSK